MREYEFWREQIAGGTPETTPGTPHAGFYRNDWRESYRNPTPTVGGPRRKVRIITGVCAIWFDHGEWLCRTDTPEGVRLTEGQEPVDEIFSRVCRNTISFEQYQQKVKEYEQHRQARNECSPVDHQRNGGAIYNGAEAV